MNVTNYNLITDQCDQYKAQLIAVSKTKPNEAIQEVYDHGQRIFGENRVFELTEKAPALPADIEWHMIGHLQRNKVKEVLPNVQLIHSADSKRLIRQIQKDGKNIDRKTAVLIQLKIAKEDSKYGFSYDEVVDWLAEDTISELTHIEFAGVMGMATFTEDKRQVRQEFKALKKYFDELKSSFFFDSNKFKEVSMGMSGDYKIALDEGSTMIRVGSAIFGAR